MTMQTRRLQRTGGSTLIVSLPKPWTERMDLDAGHVVGLVEQDNGTLVLNPNITSKDQQLRSIVETSKEPPEQLIRALISGYLGGAHVMEVRSKGRFTIKQRQAVRDFANLVIGPEIVDETAELIILQDLTDIGTLPLKTAMKRLFRITHAMHFDVIASYRERNPELIANIDDRDTEVDKLYWFITRGSNLLVAQPWLAEKLETTVQEGISYMLVARSLERVGDHAVQMAEGLKLTLKEEPDERLFNQISQLSDASRTLIQQSVDSFIHHKVDKANKTIEEGKALAAECRKLLDSKALQTGKVSIPLHTLIESLRRVSLYTTDIAETTLNAALHPS